MHSDSVPNAALCTARDNCHPLLPQDFDAKHQRALNYEDFDTAAEIRKHRQRVRLSSTPRPDTCLKYCSGGTTAHFGGMAVHPVAIAQTL